MYAPEVIDHFQNPRNVGELSNATVTVTAENPACGDLLQLSMKVETGTITAARYKVRGCATAIACGSLLTELLTGKTLDQARQIHRRQIVDALGGLTNETMHASHLAMDALEKALKGLPTA
ncbi:MAG TPA: iron-sulfur cluster assembly scaffold protein [Terriglobales bacterium]|nr:iron-sulfur cluster assembly scaffold protein [Terriglobales bacterium]